MKKRRRVLALFISIFLRNRSLSDDRWFCGKKRQSRQIGKGNLYLTENRSSWNELCCASDNHNYMCHTCAKEFLNSSFNRAVIAQISKCFCTNNGEVFPASFASISKVKLCSGTRVFDCDMGSVEIWTISLRSRIHTRNKSSATQVYSEIQCSESPFMRWALTLHPYRYRVMSIEGSDKVCIIGIVRCFSYTCIAVLHALWSWQLRLKGTNWNLLFTSFCLK